MLTPLFVNLARPAFVIGAGLVVAAVGLGSLEALGGPSDLALLASASALFSFGLAPMTTLATDIMLSRVSPERAGAASAVPETSSEFAGGLGSRCSGPLAEPCIATSCMARL